MEIRPVPLTDDDCSDPGRARARRPLRPPSPLMSNSARTLARPATARFLAASGSSITLSKPAARSAGSSGRTTTPVTPSRTSSGIPDTHVVTTGTPSAMASISVFGMPSMSPSGATTLGCTSTSDLATIRRTACSGWSPWKVTRSWRPAAATRPLTVDSSGPVPTRSSRTACSARELRSASTSTACPFFAWKLDTMISRDGPPLGACAGRLSSLVGTPQCTTQYSLAPLQRAVRKRRLYSEMHATNRAPEIRRSNPRVLTKRS